MNKSDSYQSAGLVDYRPDIDGLRAVAVLGVILFHVNPAYLSGGFLGVDVFLVISGYLITLLLSREIRQRGRIDFSAFYQRRIKRLFPALIFTIFLTLTVGMILMQPLDYLALLKSSVWSVFFTANIHFQQVVDTGYFAADSRELPLLHLWSLGVEEQFYLVWPVCLYFILRKIHSRLLAGIFLFTVMALSLLLSQHLLQLGNNVAYFMLPTRAWELMAGSIIALLSTHSLLSFRSSIRETLGWLGIALLISSLVLITEESTVPGFDAVPAIIGVMLLIVSGPATTPAALLSQPVFRLAGLLSYSAYLIHWPILAFIHYSLIDISHQIGVIVIVTTFFLAGLCYHFIEKPLRHRTLTAVRTALFYFIAPTTLLCLYVAYMTNTIKQDNLMLDNVHDYQNLYLKDSKTGINISCLSGDFSTQMMDEGRCVIPYQTMPSTLLVGDSHANHFLGMLGLFSQHFNFSFRNISLQRCPMLFAGDPGLDLDIHKEKCNQFRQAIRKNIADYQTVIIGTDWDRYYSNKPDIFEKDLRITVNELVGHGRTIILLAKIPVINGYKHDCHLRQNRFRELDCKSRYSNIFSPPSPLNATLHMVASDYPDVHVFDIRDILCQGDQCSAYIDGKPVYLDSTHLSQTGSIFIGNILLKQHNAQLDLFRNIVPRGHTP